jgi:hypothetical protein
VLATGNFLAVFDGLAVTVALPTLQRSMRLSAAQGQWVITGYIITFAGLLLLGGRLGDRYGRRRVLVVGLVVLPAGLVGAACSPGATWLIAARVVQGAGAALTVPNAYALASTLHPSRLRNLAFTAVTVAGAAAASLGGVLGGVLAQTLGWRWVFLCGVPCALAAALAAPRLLASSRTPGTGRLDVTGAGLVTAMAATAVWAITQLSPTDADALPTVAAAFAAASAMAFLFVRRERRTSCPLVPPSLPKARSLRAAVLGACGQAFATTGLVYTLMLYLQDSRGYGPLRSSAAYLPLCAASLVVLPMMNRILDTQSWHRIAVCSQALCAFGLLWLAVGVPGGYAGALLPGLVLLGVGTAGAAVSLNVGVGRDIADVDQGVSYGAFETVRNTAGAVAIAVLAAVAAAPAAAPGSADGYRLAFAAAALLTTLGAIGTALADRPR